MANGHKSGFAKVAHEIRKEAARQLRGFPREAKYQLRGFGREAGYQLGSSWGKEFARQLFGNPRSPSPVTVNRAWNRTPFMACCCMRLETGRVSRYARGTASRMVIEETSGR